VRPENLAIEKSDEAASGKGVNLIAATVVSSIYLGEIRQFTCRLGDGGETTWRVSMLSHQAPSVEEGERVHLRFAQEHVAVLQR
jgi:ABC-type Fe3+/spermidine/putrescine transport system ATPase subunit